MKQLLLVRHGLTDWNLAQRAQGQIDVPLNAEGLAQAATVGERLADTPIDVVYASDSGRAWVTAEHIVAHHPDVALYAEPRLREMHLGDWHGLTHAEMKAQFPDQYAWWSGDRLNHAPPKGESLAQLAERLQWVLDAVTPKHSGQTVMFVSHGVTLCVLLCLLVHKSPGEYWQFRMGNTAISRVIFVDREHQNGAQLVTLNDRGHLGLE